MFRDYSALHGWFYNRHLHPLDGISMWLLMIMFMVVMLVVVALSLRSVPWYSWHELYIVLEVEEEN